MADHDKIKFTNPFIAQYATLFRRCVVGCGDLVPQCSNCTETQVCGFITGNCGSCANPTCIEKSPFITTTSTASGTTGHASIGPIAGGVIGGVLSIATVTYLVWRYCIRPRRQQYESEAWAEDPVEEAVEPMEKDFTIRRDARASTHTVASLASTVLTRASNIIQIAYIPGVTNRSAPSTPGLLVPPVPPIPIALSSATSSPYEQEHFFMPGDLRDSTYSGVSDRTSYARNSVASTIYGKNAIVSPLPAQTVIRGKAAVVSVTSKGGGSSSGELTPPVPMVNYGKYSLNPPPSPAFSVGSTFLNSASAATQMKPQIVRVASNPKKQQDLLSDEEPAQGQNLSHLPRDSNAITIIDDTPTLDQGPFADPPKSSRESSSSLSAIIDEAAKRAQSSKTNQATTPFGDENEILHPQP
jgi:hypothetical protein